jgi:phosphoadenosine phosphosulfate reductase
VHIDTGVGIPETKKFVERRATALGLEFICITSDWNRGNSWLYRRIVREYGFPGPPVHGTMYARLKEKPLNRFRMEFRDEQLGFVSGVRRHESERRMETVPDTGLGWTHRTLWISPLVDWTGKDVREYRRNRGLPMNPVVERMEMSGECLCGAYADREELRMLKLFYPDVYRYLTALEMDVINRVRRGNIDSEYALWGHGSYGQRELDARLDDDQQTLCSDCTKRGECDPWNERDTDPVTVGEALGGIEPNGEP